ncbi:11695_t:CDS:1 [Gigaspora margarita]|uniref:11695_t:CDS:1 n=1 Tax=Gigaspora margarita TaxID=4874 RepID=A0ABN7UWR6_GIGMA|nr:11695_t:CDS:1 [Gigaspora margarita]
MNFQTSNFFLIALLSILLALTITVDARFNKLGHINIHDHKDLCKTRGCPGWGDSQYSSLEVLIIPHGAATPQDCCMACINDTGCAEWEYGTRTLECFLSYELITPNHPDVCSGVNLPPSITGDEGGVIRCRGYSVL